MAAFTNLDWTRFDVWSIVAESGLAVVDDVYRDACRAWLGRQGYGISTIDFGGGVGPAVVEMGALFRWEEQFGYAMTPDHRNLDALRDGFVFDFSAGEGKVLELLHPDKAYREDSRWFLGLLSIGAEYSRWQLALGHRFFIVLVLPEWSKLPGITYESNTVPVPFRHIGNRTTPFDE